MSQRVTSMSFCITTLLRATAVSVSQLLLWSTEHLRASDSINLHTSSFTLFYSRVFNTLGKPNILLTKFKLLLRTPFSNFCQLYGLLDWRSLTWVLLTETHFQTFCKILTLLSLFPFFLLCLAAWSSEMVSTLLWLFSDSTFQVFLCQHRPLGSVRSFQYILYISCCLSYALFKPGYLKLISLFKFNSFSLSAPLFLLGLDLELYCALHQSVSVDSEPWLLQHPFALIKLSGDSWALQAASVGAIRSARLLLRPCVVKLPLLHFLSYFLIHVPISSLQSSTVAALSLAWFFLMCFIHINMFCPNLFCMFA